MEPKYKGTLKERKNQASKAYYQAHREEVLEKRKAHYAEHGQEERDEHKSHMVPCPQCGEPMWPDSSLCWDCSHIRKYDGTLQERKVEAVRTWRERHPGIAYVYSKMWKLAHPDKAREYRRAGDRRRRALENDSPGSFTEEEWESLCEQYDNRCVSCGKRKPLHQDHVVPLSKGGTNYIDNIQPLCKSCNSKKGTKDTDYRY